MTHTVEVSLSPALYPFRTTTGRHITIVIDILRFTTSLISAFDHGVRAVIPVATPEEAETLKLQGYPVAAERDGLRLPFADYGNSATDFNTPEIYGKTLVYSTTNGTIAMKMASENGPVAAAAFSNINAVVSWVAAQQMNVVILCSGWKNLISIEDTICAGAIAELLIQQENFTSDCDSASISADLWSHTKADLRKHLTETSHYKRLIKLGIDPLPDYTVQLSISSVVPVLSGGIILNQH
ncbi:MAG: 2-phosphosulfolactate phosphatase [Bacteroidales bacterium]|nr:2-phosphosulfolactate phosphatase [Bacteroidales bacterium]